MFDHITIGVQDIEHSKQFYDQALLPLGIERLYAEADVAAYGVDRPFFWLTQKDVPQTGVHIAFSGKNRDAVQAFYSAGMDAGGKDNGAPGLRSHYHPNYFAAFIFDPDGHNIEAVCHHPAA